MVITPFGKNAKTFKDQADYSRQFKEWHGDRPQNNENFVNWMKHCGASEETIKRRNQRLERSMSKYHRFRKKGPR